MGRVAALFDIDGTLYREGLITEVFKKLIRYEIIEARRWYSEVKPDYDRWDKREGNYDEYLNRMATIYTEAIRGLHRSQIDFIARKVVEQKGDRVYTYTRDRIQWHREQGHLLITISGSPVELVREMAGKHGFDVYVGSVYGIDGDNCYTGEVEPMWTSRDKEEAIQRLCGKYGISLEASFAYGDTMGDFGMLRMCGFPTVINATRELFSHIMQDLELREKVNVIVERKDMIYQLRPEDIGVVALLDGPEA